jgi:hypothetical protein
VTGTPLLLLLLPPSALRRFESRARSIIDPMNQIAVGVAATDCGGAAAAAADPGTVLHTGAKHAQKIGRYATSGAGAFRASATPAMPADTQQRHLRPAPHDRRRASFLGSARELPC